ncbi:MAG: nickel pincer cofactor biosynthesis protein LarC [Myxococcaceae bacterium]|nr:nickel pincer cofactor biosynthesis protein LarC [Myxococcaceae bacterium]
MSSLVLYLEPIGGIAGDMFLASALDLGVDAQALEAQLRRLNLPGWQLKVSKQKRHEITGTHLDVLIDAEPAHAHSHGHEHPHRSLKDIRGLIGASSLSPRVKEDALRVFQVIGEAEAKIHGVPVDTVSFHEVGAIDSIVDICGAAVVLELLGYPAVYASPPPLGSGTTRIAHGVVPVPVPATLEILKGTPVRFEGLGELTTPTGAGLLKAFAHMKAPPPLTVERIGYGVGTKDFADRANVLRACLGQAAVTANALCVLEANVDDCSPQLLAMAMESALQAGALDVWVTPVTMKKGRPGHLFGALVPVQRREAITLQLFKETTTLGIRSHAVERTALARTYETVSTPWGPVRLKIGFSEKGGELNVHPEFDDCRALAEAHGVAVKEVMTAAVAARFKK